MYVEYVSVERRKHMHITTSPQTRTSQTHLCIWLCPYIILAIYIGKKMCLNNNVRVQVDLLVGYKAIIKS